MNREEIKNRFTYHAPKPGQPERYNLIRKEAKAFALLIDSACPDSREKSLAITKLQECVMWANAAIACNAETYVTTIFTESLMQKNDKPDLPKPPPDRVLPEDGKQIKEE